MSERHAEVKIERGTSGGWTAALCYRDSAGVTSVTVPERPTLLALDMAVLSVIDEARAKLGAEHADNAAGEWRKAAAKAREMAA